MTPFTIVAHPRDGFFGYIDQLGVDPFTMNRKLGDARGEEPGLPHRRRCDFDAMELINGKRFDLVRTATVEEVVDWNRCRARLDAAKDEAELDAGLPGDDDKACFAPCKAGERFAVCQHRNRSALAWESMKRILARTPEEQEAIWSYPAHRRGGPEPVRARQTYGNAPVPARRGASQPCTYRSGHVDDYFRYLERGMIRTQIASSDSHDAVHEPGYPRTWFQSPTDDPGGARDQRRDGQPAQRHRRDELWPVHPRQHRRQDLRRGRVGHARAARPRSISTSRRRAGSASIASRSTRMATWCR